MPDQTVVTIKEHFERILLERDKAIAVALSGVKDANEITERANSAWRAAANEWRGSLSDMRETFLSRDEFIAFEKFNNEAHKDFANFKEARFSVPSDIEQLQTEVKRLNTFRDGMEGKASQTSVTFGYIIAIVALIISLIGTLHSVFGI